MIQASDEEISRKLFFDLPQINTYAGLVFGSGALTALVAAQAAQLFHARKFPRIFTTGGADVDSSEYYEQFLPMLKQSGLPIPYRQEREGEYARRVLMAAGVPDDFIIVEDESLNTGENIRNALALGLDNAPSVTLIGLANAQWRALATFRKQTATPATTNPVYPFPGVDATNWTKHPIAEAEVRGEHGKLKGYIDQGFCVDLDIAEERKTLNVIYALQNSFSPFALGLC